MNKEIQAYVRRVRRRDDARLLDGDYDVDVHNADSGYWWVPNYKANHRKFACANLARLRRRG